MSEVPLVVDTATGPVTLLNPQDSVPPAGFHRPDEMTRPTPTSPDVYHPTSAPPQSGFSPVPMVPSVTTPTHEVASYGDASRGLQEGLHTLSLNHSNNNSINTSYDGTSPYGSHSSFHNNNSLPPQASPTIMMPRPVAVMPKADNMSSLTQPRARSMSVQPNGPWTHDLIRSSCNSILEDHTLLKERNITMGLLLRPLVPLVPEPPLMRRPPVRCAECRAVVSPYCPVDVPTGTWRCALCGSKNTFAENYSASGWQDGGGIDSYPELEIDCVDYVDPGCQPLPMLGGLDRGYAFVVDAHISRPEMTAVAAAIRASLTTLPDGARVSLITMSNIVSVYEVGMRGIASAELFPGIASLTRVQGRSLLSRKSTFIAPLFTSRENISNILDVLVEVAPVRDRRRSEPQQRAFGVATELALMLVSGEVLPEQRRAKYSQGSVGGRVLIFTNGPPNFGPGGASHNDEFSLQQAATYFREKAIDANALDVGIDIFCGGLRSFCVGLLQNLVQMSGGAVVLTNSFEADVLTTNVELSLLRSCGRRGLFDIRCSDAIVPTHIIGPAAPTPEDDDTDNATLSSLRGQADLSENRVTMGAVQTTDSYSVFFEVCEDVIAKTVFVQFCIQFVNAQNQRVLRVVTKGIPTTDSVDKFLDSLDLDVTSVLYAKQAVLHARKERATNEDAAAHVDAIARDLYSSNVTYINGIPSLPAPFSKLVQRLYLLRQGPMIGPILQHEDAIEYARSLFLQSSYDVSILLLEPLLYQVNADGSFARLPLVDLALQSRFVLLLDHHTDIFVWSGSATNTEEGNHLRKYAIRRAVELSQDRFPQPHIMQFWEGDSMSRWLQCRLDPLHKEMPQIQNQAFPRLEELTAQERNALLSKFHHTDDVTYCSYVNSIKSSIG